MPYGLATIWNITSKYIYNNQNKNIGIGTTTPICSLDVYCNIAEKGIKLEDKYELKPENNKKYDLVVRENIYVDHNDLIIWYNFNKEDFKNNLTSNIDQSSQKYGNLTIKGTTSNLQKEYYVGTGSAEINESLYYKIKMDNNQFNSERYTFSFWLFLNEECSNDKYILNLTDSNGDIFYFKYQTDKLIIYNDTDNYIEYTCNLNKNEWYHISIIINDTSSPKLKELLVNGIKINHTTKVGNIQDTLLLRNLDSKEGIAYIYLGYTTGLTINGYIDDFRIYKTNLDIEYIQNYVIGNITKITPGHISANGNYGIDIVNYSSNINIGTSNTPIDLRIYGDLEVDGSLSIAELVINTSTFTTLNVVSNLTVSNNVNIDNNLTVSKTITENQRTLAQKYASISQIDKHTDVIISKMTDKEDVKILYNNMPKFFQSNLILAYDFDFNIYDIDDKTDFFINNILQLNYNTNPIYSTFSEYNITPNIFKDNPINYYGTKYVKGNSSLYCGSNIFNSGGIDYYSFNTKENYSFTQAQSYTIAFWIRFNEIDRKQHIFRFGVPDNFGNTERSINIFLDSNNNLNINITNRNEDYTNIINELELKKDEWYHIVLILKNDNTIDTIPKNIDTDSNLLIKYFVDLGYTNSTTQNSDIFSFTTTDNIATIFTYVNGIEINKKIYETNITIFGNDFNTTNYFGVFDHTTTTHYLNGYIDDFKMYQTVVPIDFINKNIIGDALIIKPEQLSAIGNYGINIKNFDNIVAIGNENNDVDLHIYGLLEIKETKLTISNCDIDVIDNVLTTSNFKILETLGTSNINVSNIVIDNLISGPNFHLGSSNFINDIEIITIHNSNLNSCNITADTITVNNQLILESAILSNITIVGIDIDETFSISNNDITIRSNLIIGDNSYNVNRYDLGILEQNVVTRIEDVNSNFINYYEIYSTYFSTITSTNDIQVFDKSIIFYGNTGTDNYDIQFKNNYIRDENCNIKDEINKSYFEGVDRDRTRIKLDVGNIKLQNGFIELTHQNILENNTISILTIEENQISITSNHNITILNDTLFLSNNEYHCLLTNSNFMFDNGYGFIDNETLKIKKIDIEDEIDITKINTNNTNSNTISIDTSNQHIIGKIRGHLCSNSIIDITDEIKTTSNITGINITASNLYTSNIICDYEINFKNYETISSNTTITKDKIKVNDLHIYGGITLGEESGTTDNNINGSFGTLNIKTIKTTNNNEEDFSIDTLSNTYLGKIRGCISSNSEIDIDGEIKTNSNITGIDITATNLYTSNIRNVGQDLCSIIGILESNSIIEINCNITTTQNIYCENQFTSNTLYALNIQSLLGDDLCSITGKLENNSEINITGIIKTLSNIEASNITITDTLDVSNIINSSINDYFITSSNSGIFVNKIKTNNNNDTDYSIDTLTDNYLGRIRAKLSDNSEIDINCNITTTADINANNITITNTLTVTNIENSDYITFNNDINAINQTITCDNLNCSNIISDITIKRNNKIIITDSSVNNSELIGIQIESNCIISYDNDETNYNKYIKINKAILSIKDGESNPESNVIYYENDKINIKCDELTVTKFNVGDGTMFSFPNIISYAKYEGDTLNIPNVYIGNNTGDNTIVKEEKDVLYIDTPGDTRLNTGNLLVRGLLEISPDSLESANINSLKIYTGNFIDESTEINSAPFTRFTTQDNVTILSFSLDTLSVGINVDPSTSDDNIKLFVDGGIQTTGDIIAFKSISDKRFKTNIISFDNNDIDIVNKLNPVRFIWKNNLFNSNMANKHDIGFIAQEVKEVIPEAVSMCKIEMNDIDYHYINYERIIPYLVNNIKYLNNKIVELENKLNGI